MRSRAVDAALLKLEKQSDPLATMVSNNARKRHSADTLPTTLELTFGAAETATGLRCEETTIEVAFELNTRKVVYVLLEASTLHCFSLFSTYAE